MIDGAVYGDMLSLFPELIGDHVVFKMRPMAGGGFNDRYDEQTVEGIFRPVPGGKMGIMGGNREPNAVASLYVFADCSTLISQGMYLEEDGEIYVLTKDNGYKTEGGYVKFVASIVPGITDKQVQDATVVEKALNGFQ
jgi:hypothetical protein